MDKLQTIDGQTLTKGIFATEKRIQMEKIAQERIDELDILYEDNHLLVLVKPQNIPTCPDSSKDASIFDIAKAYLQKKYQKQTTYLGLVHRLDRPTGGILVFAKTSKAAARLSSQLQDGIFHKKYMAILQQKPRQESAELVHYLKKNAVNNLVYICPQTTEGAKRAILHYQVIQTLSNGQTLVSIDIHTGRSHQIRVQMSAIDCPLLGDMKYNPQAKKGNLSLWAYSLVFMHPTTQDKMRFLVQPPETTLFKQFNTNNFFKL